MHGRWLSGASLAGAAISGTLATLLVAGPAVASLWLIVDPVRGSPGTAVTGRTGGSGAFPGPVDPLPTYLAPEASAGRVTARHDPALVRIGELVVDSEGNGTISFEVPRLAAGRYVVIVFCPSCAPMSGGREMLGVGEFEVTPSPPSTDSLATVPDAAFSPLPAVAIVLTALLPLAVRRRNPARAPRPRPS